MLVAPTTLVVHVPMRGRMPFVIPQSHVADAEHVQSRAEVDRICTFVNLGLNSWWHNGLSPSCARHEGAHYYLSTMCNIIAYAHQSSKQILAAKLLDGRGAGQVA
jgi:hypothetical protein